MSTRDDDPEANPETRTAHPEIEPELGQVVGYGKPPAASRFKKGCSGNPKGRPKGSLNVATVLVRTLRERVVINENGQRKSATKLEATIKQIVNHAAGGDHRAQRLVLELASDAEAKQNALVVLNPVVEERDQQVIDGILKRFIKEEQRQEEDQDLQEANDVDHDQRS